MRCHYCGYGTNRLEKCPSCNEKSVREIGHGTERIEEEIKTMVKAVEPDTTVITTNKKQNNVQRNNKDIIRLVVGILIYLFGMYSKLENPVMIIFTVVSAIILLYKTAMPSSDFISMFTDKEEIT